MLTTAVLIWHSAIPDVGGYVSLLETFLPWLWVAIAMLVLAALIVRRSAFAWLGAIAAAAARMLSTVIVGLAAAGASIAAGAAAIASFRAIAARAFGIVIDERDIMEADRAGVLDMRNGLAATGRSHATSGTATRVG